MPNSRNANSASSASLFPISNNAMRTIFMTFKTPIVCSILIILFLVSCASNKHIFSKERFSNFEQLKINEATAAELRIGSKDITPTHLISIGEGIYPNVNKYELETPKTFKRFEKSFEIEVEYFYTAIDSSVKVILYQWDDLRGTNTLFENDKNLSKKFDAFQNKFNQLSERLSKELGMPTQKNIEQGKSGDATFRDDFKWKNQNGLNAYLFMFGNNNNGYRQIRLAIYRI